MKDDINKIKEEVLMIKKELHDTQELFFDLASLAKTHPEKCIKILCDYYDKMTQKDKKEELKVNKKFSIIKGGKKK